MNLRLLNFRLPNFRRFNSRHFCSVVAVLAFGLSAIAQDANPPAAPAGQNTGVGRRAGAGRGMGAGRGVEGNVTDAAADHFTIKTYAGDIYTVNFSANTRFVKQQAAGAGQAQGTGQGPDGGQAQGGGQSRGNFQGGGFNRNQAQIKATDIKVGDAITATGNVDATAKTVTAAMVMQVDPARAKQMEQLEADYGKTWLQGKVTSIDEVKVTILGAVDNAPHTFVADENTDFRKLRDPITLADIAVGDTVRVDGVIKDGAFTAATVNVMAAQDQTTTVPRRPRPQ